jgi:hypothetical protein
MEQNNSNKEYTTFRLMVTSVDTLKEQIEKYNKFFKTDFEIINVINNEVPFCDVRVSNFQISDVFGLGFGLARFEQKLRERGEIDW